MFTDVFVLSDAWLCISLCFLELLCSWNQVPIQQHNLDSRCCLVAFYWEGSLKQGWKFQSMECFYFLNMINGKENSPDGFSANSNTINVHKSPFIGTTHTPTSLGINFSLQTIWKEGSKTGRQRDGKWAYVKHTVQLIYVNKTVTGSFTRILKNYQSGGKIPLEKIVTPLRSRPLLPDAPRCEVKTSVKGLYPVDYTLLKVTRTS